MSVPLCAKFCVRKKSTIRVRLVIVDTTVEHTGSVGKWDKEPKYCTHTGHPIPLTIRETIIEPAQDAKGDNSTNVNQICEL